MMSILQNINTIIGTIRKDRVAEELRKQQEAHRAKVAEEEHRRISEQQRKMELAADFTFSEVRGSSAAVDLVHQSNASNMRRRNVTGCETWGCREIAPGCIQFRSESPLQWQH